MNKQETINNLEISLNKMLSKESVIYFLVYDTNNNPRASVKNIYDMALTLKENGFNSKILVENSTYHSVTEWMGEEYGVLEVVPIKESQVVIKLEDIIIIPEYYSNILPQLMQIKCVKIMLIQQIEYIYETLPIGTRWIEYGVTRCITTTESAKIYINTYFPDMLVHVLPPYIDDIFTPITTPKKPYIAISCRDRSHQTKIMSEFYLKFPHLRWVTFRDMVNMSYKDFATNLNECLAAVWVDDESTFGTFPLECMKSNVPLIAKIPKNQPDWIGENAFWTDNRDNIVEILGQFILSWIDGTELDEETVKKTLETVVPYNKTDYKNKTIDLYTLIHDKRVESIQSAITELISEVNDESNVEPKTEIKTEE